jgi:predicted enzyme related to lactoylglutathione lyase
MPRIVHFEIGADDPQRAIEFYQKAFGWKANKWDGPMDYWLITTGGKEEPGIDGAIQPRAQTSQPIVDVIGVSDIDEAIHKIEANGGTIVAPKMAIPGVGYAAYFTDTEGNTLGIMQDDPSVT